MSWFVYEITPIGINWDLLPTVKEMALKLGARDIECAHAGGGQPSPDAKAFLSSWKSAEHAASVEGWQGALGQEPATLFLPVKGTFNFGFVMKQDNNGKTFVVSPVPLPHLDAL